MILIILFGNLLEMNPEQHPQRFTSFLISFRDFYNNPILGNAGIPGESWYEKIGANISPISGLGNLLANFGIVGFLFFIIMSLKSSFLFSRYFNYTKKVFTIYYNNFNIHKLYYHFFTSYNGFWMFGFFYPNNDGEYQPRIESIINQIEVIKTNSKR